MLARSVEGELFAMGRGPHGELGLGLNNKVAKEPAFVPLFGLTIQSVHAGADYSAVITGTHRFQLFS